MPLPKLYIAVPQEGYQVREPEGVVLRAKPSAGESVQRLDQIGAPLEADVQLFLSPAAYQYWRVFWRSSISFGALPFLLDLVIEAATIEECQVKIVPGSYSIGITGDAHVLTMQLEIRRPLPPSSDYDDGVVLIWEIYGDFGLDFLNALEQLVNVDLPESIGP